MDNNRYIIYHSVVGQGQSKQILAWTVLEDPEQLTTISMYNKYLILGFNQ